MPPSKSKSGLSESTNNKSSTATSRVGRAGRTPSKTESDSRSPMLNSRPSVDRSPKSVDSKAALERRFSKSSTAPDKQSPAAAASLELQKHLNVIQQEFDKTKEKLISVEVEKTHILAELKESKIREEEVSVKLSEALAAQKHAEENTEIEKFRAIELEQAAIEAAQQREEVWLKEIGNVQSQHAMDISALMSANQELQRVKQELAMSNEAKNTALSHAEDAMKIAEINAEKVEALSREISQLKSLVDAKMESMNDEAAEKIKKLNYQIDGLKAEQEKAKETEKNVAEMKLLIEELKEEVTIAKRSESDALNLVEEWKKKVELLDVKLEETIRSERSKSESLSTTAQQLEIRSSSLQKAESEITCLKGKVESLETDNMMCNRELDELDGQLEDSKQEKVELERTIELLKSEFEHLEEEKIKALENRQQLVYDVESLSKEKETILYELEKSQEELENSKKAMDGMASALHEVSAEAREAKEQLLIKQAEVAELQDQLVELEFAMKSTEERYESEIVELKDEIFQLKSYLEKSNIEAENLRSEWNTKELMFVKSLTDREEEHSQIKGKLDEITAKIKNAELDLATANEERAHLLKKIKEVEADAASAQAAEEEERAKGILLKERLLDKENELQSITQENEDLRAREDAANEKITELSQLLEEARSMMPEEDCHKPNGIEDFSMVPKAADAHDAVANGMEGHKMEMVEAQVRHEDPQEDVLTTNVTCSPEEPVDLDPTKPNDGANDTDKKVAPPEPESECGSPEVETDLKTGCQSFRQRNESVQNGGYSPVKEEHQKKKKALLRKLGSLLKKNNQK